MKRAAGVSALALAFALGSRVPSSGANDFRDAIDRAMPAVVKLYGAKAGRVAGFASGFLVRPDGWILTVDSVMFTQSPRITAVLSDGREFESEIKRRDPSLGALLLKISAKDLPFRPLGNSASLKPGAWVILLGNPFKLASGADPCSATVGVFSGTAPLDAPEDALEKAIRIPVLLLDAPNNPGAYGGPVVNLDGEVVGVEGRLFTSPLTNTQVSFAIPSDPLKAFLEDALAGKAEPVAPSGPAPDVRPSLRVLLFDAVSGKAPAYVDAVPRGSPAAAAGLKENDLVLELDGQKVNDCDGFRQIEKRLRPGAKTALKVRRGDQILRIEVPVVDVAPKGPGPGKEGKK
ncbi:MAG: trypsin-like peptidase domain-containing protein [Planctomycetota bacterium]